MSQHVILNGLIDFCLFLTLLTFHEFAHAWAATALGDNTARRLGRLSLNPVVHMDSVGTLVLPLLGIFIGAGAGGRPIIVGWARPVPFDPRNLTNRRVGEMLIAMAGPAMNFLLAGICLGLVRVGQWLSYGGVVELAERAAFLSLVLCFFNLIPVPPLDGSHVLRHVIRMRDETYLALSRYGFLIVVVLMQVPVVREVFGWVLAVSFLLLARVVGLHLS